jgi:hypothetical protein
MSNKKDTFNNGRFGINYSISKIDKFYVLTNLKQQGKRVEMLISLKFFIDHFLLILIIWPFHCQNPNFYE